MPPFNSNSAALDTSLSSNKVRPPNMETKNNESGFNVSVICFNAPGDHLPSGRERQLIMASRLFGANGEIPRHIRPLLHY